MVIFFKKTLMNCVAFHLGLHRLPKYLLMWFLLRRGLNFHTVFSLVHGLFIQ